MLGLASGHANGSSCDDDWYLAAGSFRPCVGE